MLLDFRSRIRTLGLGLGAKVLFAVAMGVALAFAPAADGVPLITKNNNKIKTSWSNFGVCPDQTVCAGGHRIGGGNANPTTATLNKPTDLLPLGGKNYGLLVLVTAEYNNAQGAFNPTVTYGGPAQTLTRLTSTDGPSQQKVWIGWLNEAGIDAASGTGATSSTVSVTFPALAGRNSSAVYAAYFIGLHQTLQPVDSSSNQSDTADTSIPFGTGTAPNDDVSWEPGGYVLYATNANQSPAATEPPGLYPGFTEENEGMEGTGQGDFTISVGTLQPIAVPPLPPPANQTTTPTPIPYTTAVTLSASQPWAISVISLRPAALSTVNFPNAKMCIAPCTNILWKGMPPRDFMADGGNALQDFTSSTTVAGQVEISSGGTSATRTSANCNPGCPYPVGCIPGVNCLCVAGDGSCGPKPSAMYSYYWDSAKNMGYLFGRMRVAGNPTDGNKSTQSLGTSFDASHWNLLVSFDNDAFKEFWVDVDGGCNIGTTNSKADCVNVYYWNGSKKLADADTVENELTNPTNQINNFCNTPGRVANAASEDSDGNCTLKLLPPHFIANRVNRFLGCTDDSQTNAQTGSNCAADSLSRAVYIRDTTATADWYVEVQVPIASLTAYNGENPLAGDLTNLGFPGPRTPPTFTWDPNRSDVLGPRNDDAFDFYPLIQTTHPGMLITPPYGGSGPFAYAPSTTGTDSSPVPQEVPKYLRLNYATCESGTDPLQKDFLFAGNDPSDTTPVTLSRFKSTATPSGYRIDWSTVNEVGNAGFDVLALGPFGWVKVNEEPISAQGTDPMGPQDYSIDVPFHAATAFKLVDIDIAEKRQEHGPFMPGVALGGDRPIEAVNWRAISTESGAKAAKRDAAAREKAAEKSRNAKAAADTGTPPGHAGYPELRLKVKKDGIYRVTYEAMAAAGVDLAGVSTALISLESRAGSVPLRVEAGKGQAFGPGGFVEFFGEAVKSPYTETNVYRLAVNPRNVDNVQKDPAPAGKGTPVPWYLEKAEVHRNLVWTPISPLADPWRDDRIVANRNPISRTYTVNLDDVATAGTGASISVGIWGETEKNHVQVYLNGTQNLVADARFTWGLDSTISTPVSTSLLQSGPNTISLRLPMDHGNRFEIDVVDRYSITYPRAFLAKEGKLGFNAAGDVFKVGRLASSSVVVYRITEKKVELLTGASVSGTNGNYAVTFRGSSEPARYIVSTEAALLSPELTPVPEVNDPTIGSAQYLVVSHPDFVDALDELVAAKERQGLSVKVVDVTDVYESFSFGVFDPQAIKDFVAQAAETGTEYVLLVGGDTFDYLGYMTPRSISFIPTFYVRSSPAVAFAPSDGIFADLDGDLVADLPIGRFPVRSSADLAAVLEKTLAYAPGFRNAVFAADQKSVADDYAGICDEASDALGGDWSVTKAYVDKLGLNGAKSAMVGAINSGTALTTFVGHSDVTYWSFQQLFTTADVPKLTNSADPTVVMQWGCWNTFFAHPSLISLGDKFLVTPGRGAAAVIGPSALSESSSDLLLGKALSVELAKGGTLGKALTAARAKVNADNPTAIDVLRATNLLGDPALVLP